MQKISYEKVKIKDICDRSGNPFTVTQADGYTIKNLKEHIKISEEKGDMVSLGYIESITRTLLLVDDIKEGRDIPPIDIRNGRLWDGRHRIWAYYLCGHDEILAKITTDEESMGKIKLYFGAGNVNKHDEGYLNVDIRTMSHIDWICDVGKKLPFEDNYADEILAESVLEHIHMGDYTSTEPYANTIIVLNEWYRVLKPGGFLMIRVPNIEGLIQGYNTRQIHIFEFFKYLYGGQDYPANTHIAGFDMETMTYCLEKSDFDKFKFLHSHDDYAPFDRKSGWEMRVRAEKQ